MSKRAHAKLTDEMDRLFRQQGAEGVLRHLRARGCECYGPEPMPPRSEPDSYTHFIRCDKVGWYWLAPHREWIVVQYGPSDHVVIVNADYDGP